MDAVEWHDQKHPYNHCHMYMHSNELLLFIIYQLVSYRSPIDIVVHIMVIVVVVVLTKKTIIPRVSNSHHQPELRMFGMSTYSNKVSLFNNYLTNYYNDYCTRHFTPFPHLPHYYLPHKEKETLYLCILYPLLAPSSLLLVLTYCIPFPHYPYPYYCSSMIIIRAFTYLYSFPFLLTHHILTPFIHHCIIHSFN
jgi:hypothetical protein